MQIGDEASAATDAKRNTVAELTKQSIRFKVWRYMEKQGLAMFPRPVYNRIPNFIGNQEATTNLAQLDIFKNAKSVKVNPDISQEPVRVLCLKQQKNLYVPVPRLQTGYLNHLYLPEGKAGTAAIARVIARNGMKTYGKPISIKDALSLDLVVMGSVAVSKDGYRIGKGKGYSDLEFGLLMHLKALKPNALVVTTVHDCQVFETLPAELFEPYDVPIDIIVTPTQVIRTNRVSQRPPGIMWHFLSNRRVEMIPVLGQLRHSEMLAGLNCTLNEVDTDVEELKATRPRRVRRRTRSHKSQSEGKSRNTTVAKKGNQPRKTARKTRRPKPSMPVIDFSVKISNISPTTRLRDLKQALNERGVKPHYMAWKGGRGFCYLNFFKPRPQQGEGDSQPTVTLESVLAALSHMALGGSGGDEGKDEKPRVLSVEPAPPRQRRSAPTADVDAAAPLPVPEVN